MRVCRFEVRQAAQSNDDLARVKTAESTAVELVELVAIDGIVEELSEIVVELGKAGTHDIGVDLALAVLARMRKIARQAEAARGSAVGRS